MQIEALGYIIIPVGILLFFLNRKWLLYGTALLAGFTGASVMKVGTDLSIQPAYFLGFLFILSQILTTIKTKKINLPDKRMIIFIAICVFSIIMPNILKNSNIEIINQDGIRTFVSFTEKNITQIIYLLFCFIFYVCAKNYLKDKTEEKNMTIRLLIYGCVLVCILGIYQEIAYIMGLQFDTFFRSNANGNVQTIGGFLRIYSTALEPSMLAYYLVGILSIVISLKKHFIKFKYPIMILIIVIGILTTSTTFILGMFVLLIILIFNSIIEKDVQLKERNIEIMKILGIIIISIAIITLIIYCIKPDLIKNTIDSSIKKMRQENLSGEERSGSFTEHIAAGLKSPFLGVGFGTARSKDLLSTWICNVGFIAVGIFIWYLISNIRKLNKVNSYVTYGIANSIFVIFVCAFISVPEPYALFIWLILAIGEVNVKNEDNKIQYININKIEKKKGNI